jgi:hypothetical protein
MQLRSNVLVESTSAENLTCDIELQAQASEGLGLWCPALQIAPKRNTPRSSACFFPAQVIARLPMKAR